MPGFRAELTGCLSTPCDDNPTVVMLEAGYRHLGLDWRYINAKVEPAGLAAALASTGALGWRGFCRPSRRCGIRGGAAQEKSTPNRSSFPI